MEKKVLSLSQRLGVFWSNCAQVKNVHRYQVRKWHSYMALGKLSASLCVSADIRVILRMTVFAVATHDSRSPILFWLKVNVSIETLIQ